MDKQLVFILIGFFAICACLMTWAALGEPKRNVMCKWLAVGYAASVWLCIIALIVVTILYK